MIRSSIEENELKKIEIELQESPPPKKSFKFIYSNWNVSMPACILLLLLLHCTKN